MTFSGLLICRPPKTPHGTPSGGVGPIAFSWEWVQYLPEYVCQIWLRSDGRVEKRWVQTHRQTARQRDAACLYSRFRNWATSMLYVCLSLCLYVYMFAHVSINVSVFLSGCTVRISICLSVALSLYLTNWMYICLPGCLPTCLSLRQSVCLS